MSKLVFCVLLLTITFVAANYDFHDPDFNSILFEDITTEINDKTLRFRRATGEGDNECDCQQEKPQKEKDDVYCCRGEKGSSAERKAAREAKKQCFAEIRGESELDDELSSFDPLSCEGIRAMREKTVCAAECIAKRLDLLDDSGTFKRETLLNHTRGLIGASKWSAGMLESYIDGCLSALKTVEIEKSACNPSPLEYHHCIWKKLVEGCPAESQMDSKKCRKIRERLAKGDTSHAQKYFKKLFKN